MKLHDIGLSFSHSSDFRINRCNGSGDNLLLIFKTPAAIKLSGTDEIVTADTAVLYSKGTEQSYGACGEEYINHWLHFDANETDSFYHTIKLPFNKPIQLKNCTVCENVMNEIYLERLSGSAVSETCIDALLRLLLIRISENSPMYANNLAENHHSQALRKLRAEIYSNTSETVSISSLAGKIGLSPSYFQAVYKSQFGVSCYEDVITARISTAKYYLRSTQLSIKEISALCGCENPEHFMRQFRSRTGKTPSEYRNG